MTGPERMYVLLCSCCTWVTLIALGLLTYMLITGKWTKRTNRNNRREED